MVAFLEIKQHGAGKMKDQKSGGADIKAPRARLGIPAPNQTRLALTWSEQSQMPARTRSCSSALPRASYSSAASRSGMLAF